MTTTAQRRQVKTAAAQSSDMKTTAVQSKEIITAATAAAQNSENSVSATNREEEPSNKNTLISDVKSSKQAMLESFRNGDYPYAKKMKRDEYEEEKQKLQIELLKMQNYVRESGEKIVMIFEGRDAAGKGGTIKRINEHLNPRHAKVVALEKPTEHEQGEWYFQRYIKHLPTKGEIISFDRSWYNRSGVERVMNFCSAKDYLEFNRQLPQMERMLVGSGIRLFKFWFSVTRDEQLRRFQSRKQDPLKQWKLSPVDIASLDKWDDYSEAKEAMFFYTDTADAPWTVIKSNDKKRARINCMRHILNSIPYPDKNLDVVSPPDPKLVGTAAEIFVKDEFSIT